MATPWETAVKATVALAGVAAVWGAAALLGLLPGPGRYTWLLLAPFALVLSYALFAPATTRANAPAYDEEFPVAGDARVTRDGFEWHPVGEPRIGVRHALVHLWWDPSRWPRVDVRLAFDVPDAVDPTSLERATRRGLRAATRALPGRGKVHARAAHRDDPGPTSLVRVRLAVRGMRVDPAWGRHAAEAFARAFSRELEKKGHDVTRR